MELRGQRILVTGATGFIGGAVSRRLLTLGCAVRAMARHVEKGRDLEALGAEVVLGDLGDEDLLQRAVRDCPIVIHCAAQVGPPPEGSGYTGPNVAGTENILVAAAGGRVQRFVYLSSSAVFGRPGSAEITDDSPRGLAGEGYCDSKYAAEEAVWSFCAARKLPFTILRPTCVYGPGSTYWSVIPLKRIIKGKMKLVAGGRGTFNYVYIDNLVDAIMLASTNDAALGRAFLVNDGATTWREFMGAYAHMAGKPQPPSVPLILARAALTAQNIVARTRKKPRIALGALAFHTGSAVFRQTHLENVLGYAVRVPLDEGLRRTEAWFRETGLLPSAASASVRAAGARG